MDIVYILGSGSRWGNNEIRYSLRSVEKHFNGLDQLFIVGGYPEFIKDAIHIECADEPGRGVVKERNIKNKILAACNDDRVSDPFVCFNDDHYLNADTFGIPNYRNGELPAMAASLNVFDNYRKTITNTIKYLSAKKESLINFNVHSPFTVNKKLFIDCMSKVDWNTQWGFLIKSLYFNHTCDLTREIEDKKISRLISKQDIYLNIIGRPFFSIGDKGLFHGSKLHTPLVEVLEELYPDKSRWE